MHRFTNDVLVTKVGWYAAHMRHQQPFHTAGKGIQLNKLRSKKSPSCVFTEPHVSGNICVSHVSYLELESARSGNHQAEKRDPRVFG